MQYTDSCSAVDSRSKFPNERLHVRGARVVLDCLNQRRAHDHTVTHLGGLFSLIGIGIATPDQAKQAAEVSDGVIVGSALVQTILDHASASDVEAFIREFRSAIDS